MASYVNKGETLKYTATKNVAYGDAVAVGAHVGIALEPITKGAEGMVNITGVWEFAAKQADKIDVGADVFLNPTTGEIEATKGDAGVPAGIAMTAKAASTAGTVEVKIG